MEYTRISLNTPKVVKPQDVPDKHLVFGFLKGEPVVVTGDTAELRITHILNPEKNFETMYYWRATLIQELLSDIGNILYCGTQLQYEEWLKETLIGGGHEPLTVTLTAPVVEELVKKKAT